MKMTPEQLKEFNRVFKIAADFAKDMPNRFWQIDDTERLVSWLTRMSEIRKNIMNPAVKKPFFFSEDPKERFIQLNSIIESTLKMFPKKLNQEQTAIIDKLNLEKSLALKALRKK